MLIKIAHRLSGPARGEDTVALVGGEELRLGPSWSRTRGAPTGWPSALARPSSPSTRPWGLLHLIILSRPGPPKIDEAADPYQIFRRADADLDAAKAQAARSPCAGC